VGLFDKHKERHELNKQDRASQREARAAGRDIKQTWLGKVDELAAQHAGAIEAAQSVDMGELQSTAERVQRLATHGVDGTARVISARACGAGMGGVGIALELRIQLIAGAGAPRELTVHQDVMGDADSYPAGLELPVKIDPQNQDDAIIWADVQPPTGAAATQLTPEDRDSRLAGLERLRDRGALSAEQFEQYRAQLS
jgi:hypothetical protein